MILIADGGSTKVDWVALNTNKDVVLKTTTTGLNPSVLSKSDISNTIINKSDLLSLQNNVLEIYFYGAGCGSPKPAKKLQKILKSIYKNASVHIYEDTLAAVYASAGKTAGIVCILGTGSNSCYFDGKNITNSAPSLGYTIMDEASGNYFGKLLLRDFYYEKMPLNIETAFNNTFNLDTDVVKKNLYRKQNPNKYLASFSRFMFDFKDEKYIKELIKKGFEDFFQYRVLSFKKDSITPLYFIGSIAYYFNDILKEVAHSHNLKITSVIKRPIDNLIKYHQNNLS